jgi:hypothetical protein
MFFFTIFLHSDPERPEMMAVGMLKHELTGVNPAYETLPTGHRSRL